MWQILQNRLEIKITGVVLSIGKQNFKCLINIGANTSVVKINTHFLYKRQNLKEPIYIKSLNSFNEVKHCGVTPMPSQFLARGTLSWKIVDFKIVNYDAIIDQNFLVPFKAKINLDQNYMAIFGNKIFFAENAYPLAFDMITNLQYITNEDIQSKFQISDLTKRNINALRTE